MGRIVILLVNDLVNKKNVIIRGKGVQELVHRWMLSFSEHSLAPRNKFSSAVNLIQRPALSKP